MKTIEEIISCLEASPRILTDLLSQIPVRRLKQKRISGSWCIHEHACHIATGDRVAVLNRLDQFLNEDFPVFLPMSGESFPPDHLISMDLRRALDQFFEDRSETIRRMKWLPDSMWDKEGKHPEYFSYTPRIMLRHRLMHDHLHMYQIEELWLTRDEFLPER